MPDFEENTTAPVVPTMVYVYVTNSASTVRISLDKQ